MKRVICAFIQYVGLFVICYNLLVNPVFSQEPRVKSQEPRQDSNDLRLPTRDYNTYSGLSTNDSRLKASGDTIWYEDFDSLRWSQYGLGEGPEGWKFKDYNDSSYYWRWANQGPKGRYTSPNGAIGVIKDELLPNKQVVQELKAVGASTDNGFMMLESDWYNTDEDGQLADDYLAMDSYFQFTLDLSEIEFVAIQITQIFRWCCSGGNQLSLFVSIDYDSINEENTNWIEFDLRGTNQKVNRITEIENRQLKFHITNIVAGQENTIFRFQQAGASHHFWIIDDIWLFTPPDHDLVLERAWWDYGQNPDEGEYADPDYNWYGGYTKIPESQVQDFVGFRAAILNYGIKPQEEIRLNVNIKKDDVSVFDITSEGITIETLQRDTIVLNTEFTTRGIGQYQISSTVLSDNIDHLQIDNSRIYDFEVTERVYSRSYNPPYMDRTMVGAWSGMNDGNGFVVKYEIFGKTIAEAASIYIWDNVSSEQQTAIARGDFSLIANVYRIDENNEIPNEPVISSNRYVLQPSDTMSLVKLDFVKDGNSEILDKGDYYVGFLFYTKNVDLDFEVARETRIFYPEDASYAWFSGELGGIDHMPVINFHVSEPPKYSVKIYYKYYWGHLFEMDPYNDSLFISGTMFDPVWPEPGTIPEAKFEYLEENDVFYKEFNLSVGYYEYQIFKNAGWDGGEFHGYHRSLSVYCDTVISIPYPESIKQDFKLNYEIYPNPVFNDVTIRNVEFNSSIKIYNVVGKEFSINPIHSSNEVNINVSHLPNGIYFLKINEETHKIIINR
jgi:Secretion system C-terminal sorting domain